MNSYKDRFIRSRKYPIHFILTTDSCGENCFYFLLASPQKFKSFKMSPEKRVNLNDYGIIIASGWGHVVPEETKTILKEKYNLDIDSLK